jgi:hypothetical protein
MNECFSHKFKVFYVDKACPLCNDVEMILGDCKQLFIKAMARGLINGQIRPAWRRPIYKTGHVLRGDL